MPFSKMQQLPKDTGNDIEILGFVKREQFIVLQTSGDYFEKLSPKGKLETIQMIQRSLVALSAAVMAEGALS